MYPQDVYEEILLCDKMKCVPQIYQTICIHAVEEILDRKGYFSTESEVAYADELSNAYTATY